MGLRKGSFIFRMSELSRKELLQLERRVRREAGSVMPEDLEPFPLNIMLEYPKTSWAIFAMCLAWAVLSHSIAPCFDPCDLRPVERPFDSSP